MPLTIYRRHLDTCKHATRPRRDAWGQKCHCPIWVQGSLGGEHSLGQISPAAFERRTREEGMDVMENRTDRRVPKRPHPYTFSGKRRTKTGSNDVG
jgi:hypothetical protein